MFAAYATLEQAPTLAELKAHLLNNNPLLAMCHCGNRNQFNNIEGSLNALIEQNLMPCKKLFLT